MKALCSETGLPVEPEKDEGPATKISVLGVKLDTIDMPVCLPSGQLNLLKGELARWRRKKVCRKRELMSLIGSLSYACKVVRAGRTFLRRLIELSTTAHRLDWKIRLTISVRSVWGPTWKGKMVRVRCDNAAVVAAINSGSSRPEGVRQCLAFIAAKYEILHICHRRR